jgi:hypothetical protein
MMPIGAKMYEAAAQQEAKVDEETKSEGGDDAKEPIEGEVVDDDDNKK